MSELASFTCIDCRNVGVQQARGRARLRCTPCGLIRASQLGRQRNRSRRRPALPVKPCEGCGAVYETRVRRQRWCSRRCKDAHHGAAFRAAGKRARLSPEAQERQRLSWQVKNRRRRAAKRGGKSELYTLQEIAERDGWLCQLCGDPVPMDVKVPGLLAPTIDHIIAVSRGGDDTRANVQLAHFRCNSAKGPRQVLAVVPIEGGSGE
ncbi:HNH endonuclease [Streptomyces sp. NPDC012888]|uniref:HNH endonuclease n=1 Tax=Streptomyces sp. NPDC012888 TaxID=3364855 RepID=UPI00369B7E39